jgi:flagellin FlaB
MFRKDEKGEMGIGTMIVFIAMVLVAAVAAGVLISTAGLVQQQAQDTGMSAIADVASGFRIVAIDGDRDADLKSTIQNVTVKLCLEAGSPAIDMDEVIIEISDGTAVVILSYSTAANPSATTFVATAIRDPAGAWASGRVVSQGTLIEVQIDADLAGLNLDVQTACTIRIIPKHGAPTYESFTTPSTYIFRYVELQ